MPTIAEVRKQYPQYQDLTDQQLAEGLHRAYYSDMPFDDFAEKIGFEPERTLGGYTKEAFKGLIPGFVGLGETAITGAASLLPERAEQAVRKPVEEFATGVRETFAPAPGYEDTLVRKISEGVGSTLPTLGMLALGPLGVAGAAATTVASGAGEARQRAEEAGATEDERGLATALGTIPGALESLPPIRILRRFGFDDDAIKEVAGVVPALGRIAKAGGEEALQEASSQVLQNLIAKGVYAPDEAVFGGVGEAATVGGGAGAVVSAIAELALGRRLRGSEDGTTTEEAPPPASPAPPAPPAPPKPIESAQDLLNAPPKVAAESAPEALRNEPLRLTNEQVEEELGQMEQIQEQLATLLFTPAEIEAQAAATNVPVEAFMADLTNTYDNLATRIDVFHKNYMQRMNEDVTTAPAPPAPASAAPAPPAPAPNIQVATTPSVATSTTPATPVRASMRLTAPAEKVATPSGLTFTTAKGSTYAVNNDGTTTRSKAARPEHPGEEGLQPTSKRTVYVDKDGAERLSEIQAQGGARKTLRFDDATNSVAVGYLGGKDAGKIEGRTVTKFATDPAIGLIPVEYWGDNKTVHFGNEITKVTPPTTETTSEPVSTRAGEAVAGATAGSPALPVQRGVPAGREAAESRVSGVEPVGSVAERVNERKEDVSPALKKARYKEEGEPYDQGIGFYYDDRYFELGAAAGMFSRPILTVTNKNGDRIGDHYANNERRQVDARVGDASQIGQYDLPPDIANAINDYLFSYSKGKEAVTAAGRKIADSINSEMAKYEPAPRVNEREGATSPALTQAQRRVSRPTTEQKSAVADRIARRLAARETPRAGKGPFGKNKAVVSPRFNPRVNGFIKSIVNQIGLGNTNIIVLDRNELATPEALTATADRYGLYDGFSVEGLTADAASPNTFGAVMPLPNGQGYALFVDSGTEIRVLLENIGHELGHIVEYEALSNADKNTRNAIFDDYLTWLSENKDETTAKLIRKVRAAATAEADLADLSEDMVLSEKDQEYFKSFAEWFADNVAKWMTTSEKPLSVVEKFFSTLAAKLKRLAAYLTGNRPEFLPSQAVKNFLDGLGTPNDTMASSMIKQAMGFKGPRPIFPSIEGLKNFWGWFSGSKVVDEEGRPIIMYHGSPKVFSVFRPGGRAKAIFLSPDPYFADRFTVDEYDYDVGPIYAVYVNAKNPFDYENYQHIAALEAALAEEFEKSGGSVRATGDFLNWDELVSAIKDGDWRTIENPVVQKAIKKIGHDGFYVMENLYSPELGDRVESKNLAVYEPNQIKSAIGNNGKFSPKANDIRQSRKIARTTLNSIGNAPNKLPKFNNRIYEGVRSVLDSTRITDNMRSALYMFTSLPQQVQMFVKELPTLEGLLNVLNIRASALKDKKEGLDRNVREWSDAIKKHSKYKDEFYEIAHESTRLNGTDGRQGVVFNDPANANHPLTQRFNRLPADLQKVYRQMLKSYRDMADEYLALLSKNMSPREAARLQREMAKKRLRVYLPLYREGDYWLRYQDATNEMVVRSFKSNYERELAWKEALANGAKRGSDQMFSRVEDFFEGGGPGTFFNRVLEDLKSRGAPEAVKRSLYELYLDQIPASSVRQLYRKRDGYKGYEADLINVYSNVATRMANQLTNLEYIPEIDKVYDDIKQEAKVYSESGKSKNRAVPLLIENLDKQIEYLRDPGNSTLVNMLSSFSYYWYIIGNTSTAVINMTQLPMVVFPMLSGKYGLDEASAAMTDATKQYFSGGFDNDNIPGGVKRFPADFSFGVGLPTNSPLDKLYKAAVRQSAIRRSTGYDLVEGRKKTYGTGDYVGLMAKMEQIAGWMFQNSERFNREVTLIAAFNLEMKKNNGNVDGAIKAAIDLVNMTHGTVLTETSPRIFQTGFFKVAFTFKNFAQTQVYLQAKLLRDAVKGETREVKELAAKQLIGTMSMAFLFSGLQGMPFYSASTLLVDLLADMFGDDDDPLKSNEIVRQSVGALAHKGVVNELFMADVASRTGFNGLLWKDDDKRLEEVGPALFAAEQIFGPAYSAGMGFFRGYKDYTEGHTDRALEAIAPAAIRNVLKAWRFDLEGAKSRSGELIFDDFNRYEIFMQTLGFTPVEVARRSESAGALASRINNITKRKTALLDRYYLARTSNDKEGEKEAKEAIKKFNQNEFVRKTRNIINDGELYESFNRRRKNARNSIYGINVAEKSRRVLQDTYMLEEDR